MLSALHLKILQHALGLDEYSQGHSRRNHYVGGEDVCRPLVEMGYIIEMKPRSISGGDVWFMVTAAGKNAAVAEVPKPPKKTRSQLRFENYRNFSDAYDCTFREYLDIIKTDWYKELRNGR